MRKELPRKERGTNSRKKRSNNRQNMTNGVCFRTNGIPRQKNGRNQRRSGGGSAIRGLFSRLFGCPFSIFALFLLFVLKKASLVMNNRSLVICVRPVVMGPLRFFSSSAMLGSQSEGEPSRQ